MIRLLLVALLLVSSAASAKMFLLNKTEGACVEITKDRTALFYCSKNVNQDVAHFIKLEAPLNLSAVHKDNYLIIRHEENKRELRFSFDDTQVDKRGQTLVATYLWMVPEVVVKLFKEGVEASFIFHVNGSQYDFVLTKDEKNQFKFISRFK